MDNVNKSQTPTEIISTYCDISHMHKKGPSAKSKADSKQHGIFSITPDVPMSDFWLCNGAVATQTLGYIHFSFPYSVQ